MTASILPLPAQAYVYVIGTEDGPQKIGIANNPESRRAIFQTGNPEPLMLAASVPVLKHEALSVERYAHWLLEGSRIRGEWFNVSPDEALEAVEAAVKAVRDRKEAPPEDSSNRTASLSIRIWPSLKAEVDRIAKDDGRTTAQYVERLLIAHLQENGRWPK